MKKKIHMDFTRPLRICLIIAIFLSAVFIQSEAQALTLNVVDENGAPVSGFRWLLEEDTTFYHEPGVQTGDILSLNFHKSYSPLAAKGTSAGSSADITIPDSDKRYFVSVLPDGVFTIGGTSIAANDTEALVHVTANPLPSSQISIFVFEDNAPINNWPDFTVERGLGGFSVLLFDGGGRYGIAGGHVIQDVFGNPLGTTYDGDGNVISLGTGIITTDSQGKVTIKNLAPAKYGVQIVPPPGEGWQQTTTIEGSKTIDAWVNAGNPPTLAEFTPDFPIVFYGFIQQMNDTTVLNGINTISGRVVNLHNSAPPVFDAWPSWPFPNCWVALNQGIALTQKGIYAQPCNGDSTFQIDNVPPGIYQLVVFDTYLDIIIDFRQVTVTDGVNVNLGDIMVNSWFGRLDNYIYFDTNENGMRDDGEIGMLEQATNIRFRDGTIFQSFPTDLTGFAPYDEVFPFFHWQVAEVDFARFKATGLTVTVDAGGPINSADPWSFDGYLNPQLQPDNNNEPFRVESGPVLTEAIELFAGQTISLEWGKSIYGENENGGISGIVYYATTRAEDDPQIAAAEEWEPGIPRVTVNLYEDFNEDGVPDGPAVDTTLTDSWDDSLPTGCVGGSLDIYGVQTDCIDGLVHFNQARPGVFDGGYAFGPDLPEGTYIVETIAPPVYEHLRSQDRNVDFGDEYIPKDESPSAAAAVVAVPPCVGALYTVPDELSLFPGVPAPLAGQQLPTCNMKQVVVRSGMSGGGFNTVADFFLFTEVPIAGHITGTINNDLGIEFTPGTPVFGEKAPLGWLPISVQDFQGTELDRTYSDEFGRYNLLVPSTYTMNLPMPSGASPNMLTMCLNSASYSDPNNPGHFIPDPFYRPNFSQTCYTLQFMPGTTTYLDTPVISVGAHSSIEQFPLDCEMSNLAPVISSVSGPGGGPYVSSTGMQLTIDSVVTKVVPNPEFDGTNDRTIQRNYGFGVGGTVTLGGVSLDSVGWSDSTITGTVPAALSPGEYQLLVTRGDNGKSTVNGVTVTIGGPAPIRVSSGGSIQAAIDGADPGALILVEPGTYRADPVIMWKSVKLQGWGAGSTILSGVDDPTARRKLWRAKMDQLIADGSIDMLPGQSDFELEVGAGVMVVGTEVAFNSANKARIDGFTILGSIFGGGIIVNGYVDYLEISNNNVTGNLGTYGGGIRIGQPLIVDPSTGQIVDASNDHIKIHNNQVSQNGNVSTQGGGIALYNGTDNYSVSDNFICGNHSRGHGGGLAHVGKSDNGIIENNTIIFNQSSSGMSMVSGGGIFISGIQTLGGVTPGSGSVSIISNLIQGNQASAGDGGGIRTEFVNGMDVQASPGDASTWYKIDMINNMIVNNQAGFAGGGISMQDSARVRLVNNTVANNESTATTRGSFGGNLNVSNPQPAGIVSWVHSNALSVAMGLGVGPEFSSFSNPVFENTIVWHNRSYYWDVTANGGLTGLLPNPTTFYYDLAVLGTVTPALMNPMYSLLTDKTGYDVSNKDTTDGVPVFVDEYINGGAGHLIDPAAGTVPETGVAFDEGGNFIGVRYGPLFLTGDYHIDENSIAINSGNPDSTLLPERAGLDIDSELRPSGSASDIGADEFGSELSQGDIIGPITMNISGTPNPTAGALAFDISATASDTNTGNSDIAAAEWWIGDDPGEGLGNIMSGAFVSPTEVVTATIDISLEALMNGNYTVSVRSMDDAGNWGETSGAIVIVTQSPVPDTAGPRTKGLSITPNPTNGSATFTINAIASDTTTGNSNIIAAEWWIGDDPGHDNGVAMVAQDVFDSPLEGITATVTISRPNGDYTVNVRSQDAEGNWGAAATTVLTISSDVGGGPTSVNYQCPTDTDGDGISNDSNVVCVHLVAGDGFVKMADGYLQYIFSFKDVSDATKVPDIPGFDPYNPLDAMDAGFFAANLSAPTITVKEGQKLYLTLTNVGMQLRPDLFDPHTIHWHGFPNASAIFDGVPDASVSINQLSSITYYYEAVEPGTYLYHCHVEATEHMQMGMYGNLYVTPAQDGTTKNYNGRAYTKFAYNDEDGSTGYDRDYPIQLSSLDHNFHDASMNVQPLPFADMKDTYALINGRGYPDTTNPDPLLPHDDSDGDVSQKISSLITATQGETILLRLSNLSVTEYFTVSVLGIPMTVVGKDTRELKSTSGEKLHYLTSSVNIGGGEAFDVLLYTDGIAPGTYYLYTTNLNYLSNNAEDFGGMMTEIIIN